MQYPSWLYLPAISLSAGQAEVDGDHMVMADAQEGMTIVAHGPWQMKSELASS